MSRPAREVAAPRDFHSQPGDQREEVKLDRDFHILAERGQD